MRAALAGDAGALRDAVAKDLAALGMAVEIDGDLSGCDLLVIVTAPGTSDDLRAPMTESMVAPLERAARLGADYFAAAPPAGSDATGEPRANAQIIHVIDQVPDLVVPRHAGSTVAAAGLVAMTRIAASQMAPKVRVNAIVPARLAPGMRDGPAEADPSAQDRRLDLGALRPSLRYLVEMPVVTGQILAIGARGTD